LKEGISIKDFGPECSKTMQFIQLGTHSVQASTDCRAASHTPTKNPDLKKMYGVEYDNIKPWTRFTLQTKRATEIG
jgi:hypothetical protein